MSGRSSSQRRSLAFAPPALISGWTVARVGRRETEVLVDPAGPGWRAPFAARATGTTLVEMICAEAANRAGVRTGKFLLRDPADVLRMKVTADRRTVGLLGRSPMSMSVVAGLFGQPLARAVDLPLPCPPSVAIRSVRLFPAFFPGVLAFGLSDRVRGVSGEADGERLP